MECDEWCRACLSSCDRDDGVQKGWEPQYCYIVSITCSYSSYNYSLEICLELTNIKPTYFNFTYQ